MTDRIELAEAADRLGVHYQTAYRWVREGRLPAVRVRGRYRLEVADVDALAEARATPAPLVAPTGRRSWGKLTERVLAALRDGDERTATDVVGRLHAQQESVLDICSRVLVPALATLGEEWAAGTLSIAEEHRASEIVERLLAGIDQRRPGRPRGAVVVTAPPGEQHGLPVGMAAAVLREDGWTVELLGRDLPADALADFVAAVVPDLVVLTVTTLGTVDAADDVSNRLTAAGHDVLVGEPGRSLAELVQAARAVRAEQRRLLARRAGAEAATDEVSQ